MRERKVKTVIVSLIVIAMLLLVLPTTTSASAPVEQNALNPKIDPYLHMMLGGEDPTGLNSMMSSGVEMVSVFLETNGDSNARARLEANGVVVRSDIGNIMTAKIPRNSINTVANMPEIIYIEGDKPMQLQMDVSRPEILADEVQKVLYTPSGGTVRSVTGEGVIIGIVDTGIDFTHPDFRNADDTTRILKLWDQDPTNVKSTDLGSIPDGYTEEDGLEYDSLDINYALSQPIQNMHDYVAQRDTNGHGTHVAGIATGNGRGDARYKGVAPEAGIVFVKYKEEGQGLDTAFQSYVSDAMSYIHNFAKTNSQPCVISISLGTHWGAHDGTSLLEKQIDFISSEGTTVVVAAGNEGQSSRHISGDVSNGSVINEFYLSRTPGLIPYPVNVCHNIWYDNCDRIDIRLTTPNPPISYYCSAPPSAGTNPVQGEYENIEFEIISTVNTVTSGLGNNIIMYIHGEVEATKLWTIEFIGTQIENGHFDSWEIPADSKSGRGIYMNPSFECTIATPATSNSAITVGSYNKNSQTDGEFSITSSRGPTRDGMEKPDISAPGSIITAPNSRDVDSSNNYCDKSGTSMAAPHVAGAVALMLQLEPVLTPNQVKIRVQDTARKDGFTGDVPEPNLWGTGKVDVLAITGLPFIQVASNVPEVMDKSVLLSIGKSGTIRPALTQMSFANENTCIPKWYTQLTTIQSTHPVYPGDTKTVSLSYTGATKMKIHFEKIDIRTIDHIYIKKSNGNILKDFSGAYPFGVLWESNPATDGNVEYVQIQMVINNINSWSGYGFKIDYYGYYTSIWSTPETYNPTKQWSLSDGVGDKKVYCEVSDVNGNHYQTFDDIRYSELDVSVEILNQVVFTTTKTNDLQIQSLAGPTPTQMRISNSESNSWHVHSSLNIQNGRDYWWHLTSISPAINPYPSGCSAGASYSQELLGGTGMVQLPGEATVWRVNFAYVHLKTGDSLKFQYLDGISVWRWFNEYTGVLDGSPMNSFEIPKTTQYSRIRLLFYSANGNIQSPFSITSYEWRNNNLYYASNIDSIWTISGDQYTNIIGVGFSKIDLGIEDRFTVFQSGNILADIIGPVTMTGYIVKGENNDDIVVRLVSLNPASRGWGIQISARYCYDRYWTNWIEWSNTYQSWDITDPSFEGTPNDGQKTVYIQAKDVNGNMGLDNYIITLITPILSSISHPQTNTWYADNNPSFSFYMGALAPEVNRYYYVFDHNPTTIPNPATSNSTTSNSITLPNTADGIWYMHVLAQCQDGRTHNLGHYCVKIDTQYPSPAPVLYPATAGIYEVALSWISSSDISPLTYLVYKNNVYYASTSGTSMAVSSLSPSTTYSFFIRARDSVNYGIDSTSISATTYAAPPASTCFVTGTMISTPEGAMPIEIITAGMEIISYNEDYAIKEIKTVTSASQHNISNYLQINDMGVTHNHYLYTSNGPVTANLIQVGDLLLCIDGSFIPVTSVENIMLAEPVVVYNIEVADNHNYYANDILVHNKVWPPSCPYLWAWNGTDYISDNSLLTNSENLGMPSESVVDYYVTQVPSVPEGEQYMFKILEGELYETSYLDQIKMMTIDHDEEFNVGVAQNGEIFTYENLISPSECMAKDGTNVTDLVDENDELFFDGHAGDTITMNFTYDNTKPVKLLMRADLKCSTPPPTPENIPSPLYGPIDIHIQQENGEWQKVGAIVPRERWSTDIINITPYLPDGANILSVLLTWESHHKLDFVMIDQSEEGQYTYQEYELTSAVHSINGNVLADLNVDNEIYQALTFGDYVDFTFPFVPPQAQYRDIVMYVKGFYIYNPSFQEITGIDVFQDIEVTASFNGTAGSTLDIYFIETAGNASRINADYISVLSLGNEPSYQLMNVMDIIGENSKLLFRYYASEPSINCLTLTFGIADHEFTLNRTFICDGESLQEGTIDLDKIFSDLYNTSTELFISPYTIGEALIAPDLFIWDFGNGDVVTTTDLDPIPFPFIEPGEYPVFLTIQYPNNRQTVIQKVFTIPNRPLIAVIEIYQVVDITLLIAGRKGNTATLYIYENGVLIQEASVTRQPGDPKAQTIALTLNKYLEKEYQIHLVYDASHIGENPVWVTFDSGDCTLVYSTIFSTDNGFHQECTIDKYYLAGITQNNNEYYFDASGSYDLDGQIISYEWDFGDNVTAIGMLSSHTFNYPGEYLVNLRVTDNNGGSSTKEFLLEV